MQIFEPLGCKLLGLVNRIIIENGGFIHVAFLQAHAFTVFQINGGKKDHQLVFRDFIFSN